MSFEKRKSRQKLNENVQSRKLSTKTHKYIFCRMVDSTTRQMNYVLYANDAIIR